MSPVAGKSQEQLICRSVKPDDCIASETWFTVALCPATEFTMKINLADDKKLEFTARLSKLFQDEFELELSDFRADDILTLCLQTVCPAVYNQAVQDVRAHLQSKLDDLDGEIYLDG